MSASIRLSTLAATLTGTRPARRVLMLASAGMLAASLGLGGCVANRTYDELLQANRQLTADNEQAQQEINSLRAQIAELQAAMERMQGGLSAEGKTRSQLEQELAAARAQLAALEGRLTGVDFNAIALDPATDAALQQLAARFSDILEYDAQKGMLRFRSDVTFASGSFELTAQGQQTVAAVARALQSVPEAMQYDFVVIGHTDSQRVTSRAGRRFIDNDELSSFRAISVGRALSGAGIDRRKVMFAGYGETRPRVPNAGNGNTPANRRVELFLTKSSLGDNSLPAPTAPTAAPSRPSAPAATPRPRANPDLIK